MGEGDGVEFDLDGAGFGGGVGEDAAAAVADPDGVLARLAVAGGEDGAAGVEVVGQAEDREVMVDRGDRQDFGSEGGEG